MCELISAYLKMHSGHDYNEERHVGRYITRLCPKTMAGHARQVRVLCEKIERGFPLFFQNLKGVVQLFLLSDDSTLSTDLFTHDSSLIEVRR